MLMAVETINMMMMAPRPHLNSELESSPRPVFPSLQKKKIIKTDDFTIKAWKIYFRDVLNC